MGRNFFENEGLPITTPVLAKSRTGGVKFHPAPDGKMLLEMNTSSMLFRDMSVNYVKYLNKRVMFRRMCYYVHVDYFVNDRVHKVFKVFS